MATAAPLANEMINTPAEATGEYKEMLVRLLTRQIYAETATSEVFGKRLRRHQLARKGISGRIRC